MKRFAAFLLLVGLSSAWSMPAYAERENRSIGENGHEAHSAAKQQKKSMKKAAKKQRKQMKRNQKAQRRSAKASRRRR